MASGTDPTDSGGSEPTSPRRRPGLRPSPWNLLLVVPLLMLITPLINREQPRLLGFPFFYWFQLIWVAAGVTCVVIVYLMTRSVGGDR